MMNQRIRGDAACARPFHPIRSVEFSRKNILNSESFRRKPPKPLLQVLTDRLTEMILQEGQP
ncbi:hypothetical protein QMZ30_14365 [Pantoea sp. EA-12]|uniref:hypothetical protein n=1 Tax=Pantoea sp. EA-12 TaxID=3043303 RepID=UPI0024B57B34|nr:hypothetical protein [Pantoea sp. EA-12]MDI9222088.1 hypothetical protein [Pantoea sp. EA-12]